MDHGATQNRRSTAVNTTEFRDTLENTARVLNGQNVPWIVFGGAAMSLLGFEDGPVADIDIILPSASAHSLAALFSWPNYADTRSNRFRSDYLLRPVFGPVAVELLGGFQVLTLSGWVEIPIKETVHHSIGSQLIHLPTCKDLAAIFRVCGREKDLRRAFLIESG
jgi:hypothetical protein